MKKLFYFIVFVSFLAVSCQDNLGIASLTKREVSFNIKTPGVETRLIGDGDKVDVVYYEIYKAEDKHPNSIIGGTALLTGEAKIEEKSATLTLNLLKDQEYVALFWAQKSDATCYITEDLREVQVKYTDKTGLSYGANDESRDAFCQVCKFSTFKTSEPANRVELERPFAQINLVTTPESIKMGKYNIAIEKSSMSIKRVGTVFNVAKMSAQIDCIDAEFTLAASPEQKFQIGEDFYPYVGMNYILVPNNVGDVDIAYTIQTDVGTIERSISKVPVQKNYRTNLMGNLLTDETVIKIVVVDGFDGDELINY